jgi:hypothetical protein
LDGIGADARRELIKYIVTGRGFPRAGEADAALAAVDAARGGEKLALLSQAWAICVQGDVPRGEEVMRVVEGAMTVGCVVQLVAMVDHIVMRMLPDRPERMGIDARRESPVMRLVELLAPLEDRKLGMPEIEDLVALRRRTMMVERAVAEKREELRVAKQLRLEWMRGETEEMADVARVKERKAAEIERLKSELEWRRALHRDLQEERMAGDLDKEKIAEDVVPELPERVPKLPKKTEEPLEGDRGAMAVELRELTEQNARLRAEMAALDRFTPDPAVAEFRGLVASVTAIPEPPVSREQAREVHEELNRMIDEGAVEKPEFGRLFDRAVAVREVMRLHNRTIRNRIQAARNRIPDSKSALVRLLEEDEDSLADDTND